jgi:hypothetical protein
VTIEARFDQPDIPGQPSVAMDVLRDAPAPQGGAGSFSQGTLALAQRLFRAPERWGWESVDPLLPVQFPNLDQYPQWYEPAPPDVSDQEERYADAKAKLPKRLMRAGIAGVLGLIFLAISTVLGVIVLIIAALVAAVRLLELSGIQGNIRRTREEAARRREEMHQEFIDAKQGWDQRIADHNAAEQRRVGSVPLKFPLAPVGRPSRVDVVGGTAMGWTSLLATTGSSILSGGSSVMVLDLTGQDVAGPLATLAGELGIGDQSALVPGSLGAPWLLGDLDARDLADVLAAAMDSMRRKNDNVDLAAMDAEIIQTVTSRLERPWTFDRMVAGVRVLRATYDPDESPVLSAVELQRLTDRADLIDKSERLRDELRFVESQLSILGDSRRQADDTGTPPTSLWLPSGLSIIRNEERNLRRKGFVDQVLFQAVVHHLGNSAVEARDPVLIVAGADELGLATLESLAQEAPSRGIRLVYLFAHLRQDTRDFLGTGHSATVLMRMGNPSEAEEAAKLIGKGNKFTLSQLSRQVGTNSSETISRSVTETEGHGVTSTVGGSSSVTAGGSHGSSWSSGDAGGSQGGSSGSHWSQTSSSTWAESVARNWSTSRQEGRSSSEGRSDTFGEVYQRVYEFTVEPTQIQSLEPTVFFLVDSRAPERARIADCFPSVVLEPRTSISSR